MLHLDVFSQRFSGLIIPIYHILVTGHCYVLSVLTVLLSHTVGPMQAFSLACHRYLTKKSHGDKHSQCALSQTRGSRLHPTASVNKPQTVLLESYFQHLTTHRLRCQRFKNLCISRKFKPMFGHYIFDVCHLMIFFPV